MKKYKNKLFTLMEILAVLAIITILTTITVGVYGLILDTSNNRKTEMTIKSISAALQNYKLEYGYNLGTVISSSSSNRPTSPAFHRLTGTDVITESVNVDVLRFLTTSKLFIKQFSYETFKGNGIIKDVSNTRIKGDWVYFADAWGRPIIIITPGKVNTTLFDIGSLGKDGRYGDNSSNPAKFGEGDDITNFNR